MSFLSKTSGLSARRRAARRFLRPRGFTLLEILVVLAIIGLLAGLAITNVDKIFGSSQVGIAKLAVNNQIKTSLTTYKINMGNFPSTSEGLQALITRPAANAVNWNGPYFTDGKMPLDPWNEPYQYEYPGKHNKEGYDLWSKGPDKQSGTADDIGNWETAGPTDK